MMLTPAERIISNAHKNLRPLRGYQEFHGDIVKPNELKDSEVIGVYQGRDNARIFITTEALFIETESRFIHYSNIASTTIDISEKSKREVETINITLKNGDTTILSIKQPIEDNIELTTQEVWSVYTFLRKAISVSV